MNVDEFTIIEEEYCEVEDALYHLLNKLDIPIRSKLWDAWCILRETNIYTELTNK